MRYAIINEEIVKISDTGTVSLKCSQTGRLSLIELPKSNFIIRTSQRGYWASVTTIVSFFNVENWYFACSPGWNTFAESNLP